MPTLSARRKARRGSSRGAGSTKAAPADLFFSAALETIRAALDEARAGEPFDVIVQPAARRSMRLLVADMDSTLIGQECVDELAASAGVGDRVAVITERAMEGEIAFEPALRERVALLRGLPESTHDGARSAG